jgi:hypothetical protein
MPSTKFNVVYHVATLNHWQHVVREQIPLLLSNCNIEQLAVTCASNSQDEMHAAAMLVEGLLSASNCRISCKFYKGPLTAFEHCAMKVVDDFAHWHDIPVLYFHAKGVSYQPPSPIAEKWRRHLNQFVAEADKWAAFLVNSHHDACGPMLLHDPSHGFTYFAGNFWIASSRYLRQLPPYDEFMQRPPVNRSGKQFIEEGRYLAELAIDRARHMNGISSDGTILTPDTWKPYLEQFP